MAAKKKSTKKTATKKAAVKVKDLAPKKDPRGGSTSHGPKGGKKNDY